MFTIGFQVAKKFSSVGDVTPFSIAALTFVAVSVHKPHRVDRRQMVRQTVPRHAAIFADPEIAGRGAHCEPLAAGVDVEGVAEDQVVGVLVG